MRYFFSLWTNYLWKFYSKIALFGYKIRVVLNIQALVVENRNKTLGII